MAKVKQLVLEVNKNVVKEDPPIGGMLLVTPPINEDYWTLRVQVSPKQAVVGFPKFTTIGIGFQHEKDWNTNLPFCCNTMQIYNHISHNRAGADKTRCIEAIRMIQQAVCEMGLAGPNNIAECQRVLAAK